MQKCPFIPSELDEVPYPERSQGPGACARSRLVDSKEVLRMLLRCIQEDPVEGSAASVEGQTGSVGGQAGSVGGPTGSV